MVQTPTFLRSLFTVTPMSVWLACIAVGAAAGALGHRAIERMADEQLEVSGQYVANQFETSLVARLRALEAVAALDVKTEPGHGRDAQRRVILASLARLHPEFVWIGLAEAPGRIIVAHRGTLEGVDVSRRDWWSAGLRGPWLGPPHEAGLLKEVLRTEFPSREPPRLLDVAVPLREADGSSYGVMAAHIDAQWVLQLRDVMASVADALPGLQVVVLQRDGRTVSGRPIEFDGTAPGGLPPRGGLRTGWLDGTRRQFSLHQIEGDVVVDRLGWQVVVARSEAEHGEDAWHLAATSIAAGVLAGALAAALVAWRCRRQGE